ncbi:solute carrier family 25 member 16-like [Mercenaria mercenaria]|uniref:solute carrier family 25 member 16-like n=1 Tax=Mercenaria mercenaria TaxID=6596 RepID=UPI001E1DB8D2|nr:solute carrier family 25 member 16-like [Mercenaria mercenaria]
MVTEKKKTSVIGKTLLAGGIAGCCAKTVVAPLDRVKILMQGHNKFYKNTGVYTSLTGVYNKEGFWGLYKGNYVQMVRVFPYAAIQFMSYEQYRGILQTLTHHDHHHLVHLCSGSLAGMTAVLATYPLDVMRARIAFQLKGEQIYYGVFDTVRTISQQEGKWALFRGIVPTLLGMVPYGGMSFYTFETTKTFLLDNFPDIFGSPCPKNTGGLVLILPAKLLCGSIAGATAQSIVYPLDVVRRKIQLSTMLCEPHKYTDKSLWSILKTVYCEHGIKNGLYRGITINYLRVVPMTAVSFSVFETMKQLLGLDTGVSR